MADDPRRPTGLLRGGREYWNDAVARFDMDHGEVTLLTEICRAKDRLDTLDAHIRQHGVILADGRVNPAVVEARQLQIVIGRMISMLRIPEDGKRPQLRAGVRGPYAVA